MKISDCNASLPMSVLFLNDSVIRSICGSLANRLAILGVAMLPFSFAQIEAQTAAGANNESLAALVQVLAQTEDAAFQRDVLKGMNDAFKGVRQVTMPDGWEQVERNLETSGDSEVRALAQSLSLTFGSQRALADLRKTLADSSANLEARRLALDALLGIRDSGLAPALQMLLRTPELRRQALRALASYDDRTTPQAILEVYAELPAVEKRDALNTLSSRVAFAKPLLAAVGDGKVPPRDLTADLIRQLRNLESEALDRELVKVWGVARESSADKQREIAKYRQVFRAGGSTPGDAARGRGVFARACAQCHTLFGTGGKVGPDLTGSNRGDLDYILENMVDPNAVIPNEYRSSTLETKDARVITGIVGQQDAQSVTITTANEALTIPRDEIESINSSEISMMPEGLLANLADQEIRDLIYYLTRPGQAPLIAGPDTIDLFFNGVDLTNWDTTPGIWKVENGELVGFTRTGLEQNDWIKSQMEMGDFRLICSVKLNPNTGNSGIQFRSLVLPEGEVKGYQADIGAEWWGKLYEEHGREILWNKSGDEHVKPGDWNTYEIVAVGNQILTAINGKPCVNLTDPFGAQRGIIALQLHAGGPMEVRFKDFKLELNPVLTIKTAR
ncbi:MAG: DUF1080 domain-containing protein [Verrucomicrobia bacterium]|nr:DUF1080 domain-containing protein [Verrucomicrobiota bacterium]